MHLWTEYEGRTIAEHYTLGRLLRSEGRNGFFATADQDGHPAVIRLTEAHFDEAEQLQRWRHVAEVHQPNLIEIEQVGQTTFEGVALTYALMEPDDANLGDVLKERPLTTAETLQVAKAVLAALRALHASGLVHEHIEPANVLAVGETVKLRSDCVRECVADGEFNTPDSCADLRRRDLHGFGTLLLRCLTLETEWSPAHNNLPDPFKRLIPKALEGTWTLEQLGNALDPTLFTVKPAARSVAAPLPPVAAVPPLPATPLPQPRQEDLFGAASTPHPGNSPAPRKPLVPPGVRNGNGTSPTPADPEALRRPAAPLHEPVIATRSRQPEAPARSASPSKAMWGLLTLAALLILGLGWYFLFGSKAQAPATNAHPAPIITSGAVPQSVAPAAQAPIPQPPSAPAPSAAETGAPAGAPGWYVIAYTYNHEGQAATKVKQLRRTHNSLHPRVFTPTGNGPFLVALGGPMSEQQADQMLRHARRSGLPRDTFVRHY